MSDTRVQELRTAMSDAGITPPQKIVANGRVHRFATNGGASDDAGWLIVRKHFASFGDHRTGAEHVYFFNGTERLTPQAHKKLQREVADDRKRHEDERRKRHAKAQTEVERIWKGCKPAPDDHPYLVAKRVKPHGTRVDGFGLLVFFLRSRR